MLTEDGKPDREISVKDYFEVKHKTAIKNPYLPTVNVGTKDSCFPVVVCVLAPAQRVSRSKMTPDQESRMIKECALKPHIRKGQVQSALNDQNYSKDPFLLASDIEISSRMISADARVLEPPTLLYARDQVVNIPVAAGAWNMRGTGLRYAGRLDSWAVVLMTNDRNTEFMDCLKEAVIKLGDTMKKMGIKVNQARPSLIFPQDGERFEDRFVRAIRTATEESKCEPQLVLVILESSSKDTYSEVKYVGDVLVGVPTQCVQRKQFVGFKGKSANDQYLANVILKINSKIGGSNTEIKGAGGGSRPVPRLPIPETFHTDEVMFLGADVNHPSNIEDAPSVSALVGSIDNHSGSYASTFRFQKAKEEIITGLEDMMTDIFKVRMSRKMKLPDVIVYYRDGVGEGNFAYVIGTELACLKASCRKQKEGYDPKFLVVIVSKRHHTRMFPSSDSKQTDRSGNVQAGTVVDGSVCDPRFFEFFLLSHAGIQGTSRPTKYTIVHDETGVNGDEFQKLTYHL
jgi:hypothetical protein